MKHYWYYNGVKYEIPKEYLDQIYQCTPNNVRLYSNIKGLMEGEIMKYESEFRIKEKEFRPRKDFKHQQVVDELANIVKRADLEIEELEKANYNGSCVLDKLDQKVIYANAEIRTYQYLCGILCLCVVVLGIAALS
jgi:hypothetical protein